VSAEDEDFADFVDADSEANAKLPFTEHNAANVSEVTNQFFVIENPI
jgi:hypothetical protein